MNSIAFSARSTMTTRSEKARSRAMRSDELAAALEKIAQEQTAKGKTFVLGEPNSNMSTSPEGLAEQDDSSEYESSDDCGTERSDRIADGSALGDVPGSRTFNDNGCTSFQVPLENLPLLEESAETGSVECAEIGSAFCSSLMCEADDDFLTLSPFESNSLPQSSSVPGMTYAG